VLHVDVVLPLALAALIVESTALVASRLATREDAEWARPAANTA
jgi:hypothetical protein